MASFLGSLFSRRGATGRNRDTKDSSSVIQYHRTSDRLIEKGKNGQRKSNDIHRKESTSLTLRGTSRKSLPGHWSVRRAVFDYTDPRGHPIYSIAASQSEGTTAERALLEGFLRFKSDANLEWLYSKVLRLSSDVGGAGFMDISELADLCDEVGESVVGEMAQTTDNDTSSNTPPPRWYREKMLLEDPSLLSQADPPDPSQQPAVSSLRTIASTGSISVGGPLSVRDTLNKRVLSIVEQGVANTRGELEMYYRQMVDKDRSGKEALRRASMRESSIQGVSQEESAVLRKRALSNPSDVFGVRLSHRQSDKLLNETRYGGTRYMRERY